MVTLMQLDQITMKMVRDRFESLKNLIHSYLGFDLSWTNNGNLYWLLDNKGAYFPSGTGSLGKREFYETMGRIQNTFYQILDYCEIKPKPIEPVNLLKEKLGIH